MTVKVWYIIRFEDTYEPELKHGPLGKKQDDSFTWMFGLWCVNEKDIFTDEQQAKNVWMRLVLEHRLSKA